MSVKKLNTFLPTDLVVSAHPTYGIASGSLFFSHDQTGYTQNFDFAYGKKALQVMLTEGSLIDLNTQNMQAGVITIEGLNETDAYTGCYIDREMNFHDVRKITVDREAARVNVHIDDHLSSPVLWQQIKAVRIFNSNEENKCHQKFEVTKTSNSVSRLELEVANTLSTTGETLVFTADLASDNVVNVNITMKDQKRFVVPEFLVDRSAFPGSTRHINDYVQYVKSPFSFTVHKYRDPSVVYFDSSASDLHFEDFMITIENSVPLSKSPYTGVFGIGERADLDFFYPDGVYTLWARDEPNPLEDGKAPGKNIYSSHPIYVGRSPAGQFFGVMNLNANAQDFLIKNDAEAGKISVKETTVGGIIELYIIGEGSVEDVSRWYQQIVTGTPVLPPFFAMGWNQCKWGYKDTADVNRIVNSYQAFNIPLDTMWTDIDYLDNYNDFTFDDAGAFHGLNNSVLEWKKRNVRYVPIIDAGIAYRPGGDYDAYNLGHNEHVFVNITN